MIYNSFYLLIIYKKITLITLLSYANCDPGRRANVAVGF